MWMQFIFHKSTSSLGHAHFGIQIFGVVYQIKTQEVVLLYLCSGLTDWMPFSETFHLTSHSSFSDSLIQIQIQITDQGHFRPCVNRD